MGELIERGEVLARSLMYDAHQRDGRAMLRAWGEVVEGANDLWSRLPQASDVPGTGKQVIDQLERSARTLRRAAGDAREVDSTLQEIGQVFTQAAEMIGQSGVAERREPTRWTSAQLRDSFAARVSIMHTLYVASHAVSVALSENALAEQLDARLRHHRRTPAHELRHRVLGVEQVAHSYINGHYPQALTGKQREPVDHVRIPSAIAAWDVYAQRVLTQEPTTHAMARVAEAAFAASTHAHRMWRAAVQAGHVDQAVFDSQIAPALETMIEKWGEAHTRFKQLTHPHETSPPSLREAGWELADAMREVTTTPVGPASAKDIGNRADMPSLVRSLHRFHATVAGVGALFHETARQAPLEVDARAANDIIKAALDTDDERLSPSRDAFAVTPRDVQLKRAVPLPDGMRGRLENAGHDVATATRASLRATMAASDRGRDAMTVPNSWTHHVGSGNKLPTSRDREQSAATINVSVPHVPR
ncbi:hypothetical protein [Ornithinimicrobium cryptoxanthini]|uniref:PPE family protein n=1 Tax=Ornithinimicrobium cryptoxanthini TaxID=2934161 RepID=A0ABY4YM13_9MICO|nr:hypothetical protein [Ornithinimicrobium cryptoxanthini]USQ77827.1 hypothetical protein NF557_08035 [Ornithinimicrobium cryptoxanthini]